MGGSTEDDHHESSGSGLDTLMSLKVALIFILFAIVYLGMIPALSKHCRSNQLTLSFMNCFAGGVFLAMAFMHILPEAVETYYEAMLESSEGEIHSDHARILQLANATAKAGNSTLVGAAEAEEEHGHSDRHSIFPLPYLLFFVGYCLVLFIDRVLAGHYSHNHERLSAGGPPCPDHVKKDQPCPDPKIHHLECVDIEKTPPEIQTDKQMTITPQILKHQIDFMPEASLQKDTQKTVAVEAFKNDKIAIDSPHPKHVHYEGVNEEVEGDSHHGHSHADNLHPLEKKLLVCGVNITPLILLIAIGFHSIFEGIALGIIKNTNTFINLMIGVTLHHIAATISLGVSLGQHRTQSKLTIFFIFFGLSLIESTGIAIGIGLNSAPVLVSSIVLSIAGGTFVYIACSEILVHEFEDKKYRYLKFFFFLVGYATITLLWFLHEEE